MTTTQQSAPGMTNRAPIRSGKTSMPTTTHSNGQDAEDRLSCGDAAWLYGSPWSPFPLPPGKKFPPPSGRTGRDGVDTTDAERGQWFDACRQPGHVCGNVALRMPDGVLGIDVDAYGDKPGAATLAALEAQLGSLPASWRSTSRGVENPSGIRFYRVPSGVRFHDAGPGIEVVQRVHRYAVVWPSIHPEGRVYRWVTPEGREAGPRDVPRPEDLPELPPAWVAHVTEPERPDPQPVPADSPGFGTLPLAAQDGIRNYLDAAVRGMVADLNAAAVWPEGQRDTHGRGWEKLAADTAHRLACLAVSPWTPWDLADAEAAYGQLVPGVIAEAVPDKWRSQAARAIPLPFPREHGLTADAISGLGLTPPPAPALAAVSSAQLEAPSAAGKVGEDAAYAALVDKEYLTLKSLEDARKRLRAEQDADAPALDIGTVDEVLAREPEPAQRVNGLIPAQAGVLVVGQRKVGKTTLLLGLVGSLLKGGRFLGRFDAAPSTGKAAFLNYEVTGPLLARWAVEAGVPTDRLVLANLRGRRNPLAHEDDRRELAAYLRGQGVEVLVVDPFSVAFRGFGTNENASGEVRGFLTALDEFARSEVGASIVILSAHSGWEGERTRGSSALEDWPDVILTLRRDTEQDNGPRYLTALGRDPSAARPSRSARSVGQAGLSLSQRTSRSADSSRCRATFSPTTCSAATPRASVYRATAGPSNRTGSSWSRNWVVAETGTLSWVRARSRRWTAVSRYTESVCASACGSPSPTTWRYRWLACRPRVSIVYSSWRDSSPVASPCMVSAVMPCAPWMVVA
jgi:hypothetical protein